MKTEVRRCAECGHVWFLHRYKIRYSLPIGACNHKIYDDQLDASLACGCEGFR